MSYSQSFQIQQLEELGSNWCSPDIKDQLKQFIYKIADAEFEKGNTARNTIRTIKGLEKWRLQMRKKFIASLGGLPTSDTPLNAKITGVVQENGFRIENIIFESRPDVYVTANMYIPDEVVKPGGCIQFLCGHFEKGKYAEQYQIVCRILVQSGLIVFAQDPVGQGERVSYFEPSLKSATVRCGSGEHDYAGIQCLTAGHSIARYFVHDAMRGIDYLCTRPEVDKNKIGVTGNSGGGTQTAMMMLCDQRIAAAAPATYLTSAQAWMHAGGAQDLEQIWPGMTAAGFEHKDILMMMAPRPVMVLAATYDYFPVEATRQTVTEAGKFWKFYGKLSNLELFEQQTDHNYTGKMAAKAAEFFARHLLGRKIKVDNSNFTPIPCSQLYCTKTGQIRGEINSARFVYEENKANVEKLLKYNEMVPEKDRREKAIAWLKSGVFYNRKPCSPELRVLHSGHCNDLLFNSVLWWSQNGLMNHALVFRNYSFAGKKVPLTIAVWNGGSNDLQTHMNWLRTACASGCVVMVLNVAGAGAITPNKINVYPLEEGTISRFAHDLLQSGDSITALRTYDVVRALDMALELPDIKLNDISLYCHGRQGIYGLVAALIDPRIKIIIEDEPLESYAGLAISRHYDDYSVNSIIWYGILKYCDLPDVRRWLGKRYKEGKRS